MDPNTWPQLIFEEFGINPGECDGVLAADTESNLILSLQYSQGTDKPPTLFVWESESHFGNRKAAAVHSILAVSRTENGKPCICVCRAWNDLKGHDYRTVSKIICRFGELLVERELEIESSKVEKQEVDNVGT